MRMLSLIGRGATLKETKQLYEDSFSLEGWDKIEGWLSFSTNLEGLREITSVLDKIDYFLIQRSGTDEKMSLVEKAQIFVDVGGRELKIELGPQRFGEIEKGIEGILRVPLFEDRNFRGKNMKALLKQSISPKWTMLLD